MARNTATTIISCLTIISASKMEYNSNGFDNFSESCGEGTSSEGNNMQSDEMLRHYISFISSTYFGSQAAEDEA